MHGKSIILHTDGVGHITLLYRPEVTDELTLSVSWLRSNVAIDLTEREMRDLAHRLTKGVKKIRKHKRKLDKDRFVSLEDVEERIHKGNKRR